ncbi:unnamed protein product [Pieris brassicae]|uniref:Uncharacterized protein n=1 Tax=Pieris brassicae TaxID=7116 RepID=A0A9P0XET7_PIEBR|nr:unnamed protein product [Pieris brassicae]
MCFVVGAKVHRRSRKPSRTYLAFYEGPFIVSLFATLAGAESSDLSSPESRAPAAVPSQRYAPSRSLRGQCHKNREDLKIELITRPKMAEPMSIGDNTRTLEAITSKNLDTLSKRIPQDESNHDFTIHPLVKLQ